MQTNRWAIVLAAGEGSRLRSLTTNAFGESIPKQFCSLRGDASLLNETLRRAQGVVASDRISVVVSALHARWWAPMLSGITSDNIVVQPNNRGTANGILLPLLNVIARDPQAEVVILPSDHHVQDEPVLASSIKFAMGSLSHAGEAILLLGMAPDEGDPDLGYIVPSCRDAMGTSGVSRFVEKPSRAAAQLLVEQGALWNSFIIVARARALLELLAVKHGDIVTGMRLAHQYDALAPRYRNAVANYYADLRCIDFSTDILQGAEARLRIIRVDRCGWSDLGTPRRVFETLRRLPGLDDEAVSASLLADFAPLNLSTQSSKATASFG